MLNYQDAVNKSFDQKSLIAEAAKRAQLSGFNSEPAQSERKDQGALVGWFSTMMLQLRQAGTRRTVVEATS